MSLPDAANSVMLASDALTDALTIVEDATGIDVAQAHDVYVIAKDVKTTLTALTDALATKIGDAIGSERTIINDKPVKRHAKFSHRNWDSENLLRAVLDSRLLVEATGELVEETPTEKLQAVYGLKGYNASRKALLARQIDPTEFCESEFRGWTLADR